MTSEIATKRLLLRPFREADAEAVLAYAGDESFAQFISPQVASEAFTLADAQRFGGGSPERPGPLTAFAIECEGVLIGSVHLLLDPARSMAELACLIARPHWARG